MNVQFVNSYKTFKNRQTSKAESEVLKEDLRGRVSYFSDRYYSANLRFVEVLTSQIRCSRYSVLDNLQRLLRDLIKRKAMSLLEALLARDMDKYHATLLIDRASLNDIDHYTRLTLMLDDIDEGSHTYIDTIDDIARSMLTQKTLNDEICKLIVVVCDN